MEKKMVTVKAIGIEKVEHNDYNLFIEYLGDTYKINFYVDDDVRWFGSNETFAFIDKSSINELDYIFKSNSLFDIELYFFYDDNSICTTVPIQENELFVNNIDMGIIKYNDTEIYIMNKI